MLYIYFILHVLHSFYKISYPWFYYQYTIYFKNYLWLTYLFYYLLLLLFIHILGILFTLTNLRFNSTTHVYILRYSASEWIFLDLWRFMFFFLLLNNESSLRIVIDLTEKSVIPNLVHDPPEWRFRLCLRDLQVRDTFRHNLALSSQTFRCLHIFLSRNLRRLFPRVDLVQVVIANIQYNICQD